MTSGASDRAPSVPPPDLARRADADRFVGELLDASADERAAMRANLHRDDPALAALVDSLLVHLEEIDGFLEGGPCLPIDDEDAFVDERFGHWAVRRAIGRGGMGLVFEVERDDGVVRQRAALKLLQRAFGDRAIVARFATERQILAGLDHPSIARLIDAGASDGRPYLVMDYVDGVPLDAWCDARALSIDDRIRLFGRICDAVHYAHQRLVVHRDLKPGNILVTADGTPKLLDFGISKLLGDDGRARAETIDAVLLLTPRYASPEQLTGAPISTASDVYSLGVLLFELLTGTTPYRTRNDTLVEMMRAVMTEEPTRASEAVTRPPTGVPLASERASSNARTIADASPERVARRLRGDLDQILAKALAKEPGARYESAAALRDDLGRHLAGSPIAAVPPSWRYRAGKFVRKHRGAVALATTCAVIIVALALIAAAQALRAERERDVAERRFEDTRMLAKTMLFDVNDAIANGPTKAREQLVRTALTYLDKLSQDRLSPQLQRDVAAGYERIAEILGSDNGANLGRPEEAKAYLLKALAMREQIARSEPTSAENLRSLASVYRNLGNLEQGQGAPADAAKSYEAATRFASQRAALQPTDVDAALVVFVARRNEANVRYYPSIPNLNEYDDALRRLRELIHDLDAYAASHPEVQRAKLAPYLNAVLNDMTRIAQQSGDAQPALDASLRSLALSEQAMKDEPDNPVSRRRLLISLRATGDSLLELGRTDEGLALLRRSLEVRAEVLARDPSSVTAARDVSVGHAMMGVAYQYTGRARESLAEYEAWVRSSEELARKAPDSLASKLDLEQARWCVAEMHLAVGRADLALSEARRVEQDVLSFDANSRNDDSARESLAHARLIEARSMVALGSPAPTAFSLAKEGLQVLAAAEEKTPDDVSAAVEADRARIQAGRIALADAATRDEGCALSIRARDGLAALDRRHRLGAPAAPLLVQGQELAARCIR